MKIQSQRQAFNFLIQGKSENIPKFQVNLHPKMAMPDTQPLPLKALSDHIWVKISMFTIRKTVVSL